MGSAGCSADDEFTPPPAASDAQAGGTLRVAIRKPASIDPQNAFEPAGQQVVQTMCDPLLTRDLVTGELRPGVVDAWSISQRGTQMNLRIRKGAKFTDGTSVTAEDVRFTLTRIASAEYASNVSDLMRPVNGFGFVHGDEETDDEERIRRLGGVSVIESRSFEITLSGDHADWIRVLTHPASSPVPRKRAESDVEGFAAQPVCVGPYRLAEPWTGGDRITLVRSDTYQAANPALTAGGAGWADRIEFHTVADLGAAAAAFREGRVDVAEVPDDQLAGLRAEAGDSLVSLPAPGIDYVGLPASDGRLADVGVRRLLSDAVDRRRLADEVYAGGREPARGFLPPVLGDAIARQPACPSMGAATGPLDLPAALAAAPVRLHFNDELGNRPLVEAVAAQWREGLGIEVELAPSSWEAFVTTGAGAQGFDGAFRFSWVPDYLGPDAYLAPLFASSGVGRDNFSRWTDPGFDRILERSARRALEEEDRILEYQRLEDIACKQLPLIPLLFDRDQYLVRAGTVAPATDRAVSAGLGGIALRELYLTTTTD